jgi:hypothetical protein
MLAQIPEIDKGTELRAETFKGGFVWAVNFKLPQPAEQDGYIVQKIQQIENGTIHKLEKKADGSTELVKSQVSRVIYYWEAWEVKKGETTPRQQQTVSDFAVGLGGKTLPAKYQTPVNDIFYRKYEIGSVGTYTIRGYAGFYHSALTSDFIVGNPQTGAGQLKSTTFIPPFWSRQAALFRELTFRFDFMDNIVDMKGSLSCPVPFVLDFRPLVKAFGF